MWPLLAKTYALSALEIVAQKTGRSGEIRTPDPLLPKQVRYQAALHSVWLKASYIDKRGWPRNKAFARASARGRRPSHALLRAADADRRASAHYISEQERRCRPGPRIGGQGCFKSPRRIGAWPSGKATGFGPVIPGSNPGAPATQSPIFGLSPDTHQSVANNPGIAPPIVGPAL